MLWHRPEVYGRRSGYGREARQKHPVDMLWHTLTLLAGLAILSGGGEALVRGATLLARACGISSLVVGLTVVAFGTSAPELAVSLVACIRDEDAIAIGNVVGSNIANILLVLGLAATLVPVAVTRNLLRVDATVLLAATLALAGLALLEQQILRWQGIVLAVSLVAYVWLTYRVSGVAALVDGAAEAGADRAAPPGGLPVSILLVLIGLTGLTLGADWIVRGATGIAEAFGLSRRLIGVTVVAVGTSLPEIATTISAARQRHADIALGNIVGSNIFNLLCVLGVAATAAAPISFDARLLVFDVPVMVGGTLLGVAMMRTGFRVGRGEGVVLLVLYAGYLVVTARGG
jgi:cation:H+ antiporter